MTQSRKYWWWTFAGIVGIGGVFAFCGADAVAQITPDTTLGTENSVVTPNVDIQGLPADLIEGGATRGAALFHSFSEFNVGEGLRVYFANPGGIETIFSRVTGSDVSDILGTLGVDGGASLFLLNPNGIIFGENARLDIAGSFVGSTANSVVFENGVEFSATNPEAPPLLTINLTPGLQYGSNSNGRIANAGNLEVGQDLTLAADNLDLQGQLEAGENLTLTATDTVTIRDTVANPFMATAGEQLLIQGNQTIDIFALNHPDSGLFSGGNMVLRSANTVGGDAHYWSGGSFAIEQLDGSLGGLDSPNDPIIRANQDVFLNSYTGASLHIFAGGLVFIPGTVRITAPDTTDFITEEVTLSDGITQVSIDGSVEPTLDIRAGIDWTKLGGFPGNTVEGTVFPFLGSFSPVPSADIIIGEIRVGDEGKVFLTNQYQPNTLDTPFGGIVVDSISTRAGEVVLDSRGGISIEDDISTSAFFIFGGSQSADVMLLAQDNIEFNEIDAFGSRQGGNVTIQSGGDVLINDYIDAASDDSGNGGGGDVTIQAEGTIILDGNIDTSSFFLGSGGDVTLRAKGDIFITPGFGFDVNFAINTTGAFSGNITLDSDGAISIARSFITTDSFSPDADVLNQGGDITVTAQSLSLTDGALLSTNNAGGDGNSGNINITTTDFVSFDGVNRDGTLSGVESTVFPAAEGNGGNIGITTRLLSITNGAGIFATTAGKGNAGNIRIYDNELVVIDGRSVIDSSVFLREGNGGDINITTNSLLVRDNSLINASTFGKGDAGNVMITSTDSIAFDASTLGSLVFFSAEGKGGDINITTDSLSFTNGAAINASTQGKGDAGQVTINATDSVSFEGTRKIEIIEGSGGISSQVAFVRAQGEGGDINITTGSFSVTNGAAISATTMGNGNAGNVTITASDFVSIDGSSIIESGVFLNAEGDGGDIEIKSQSLLLSNDARIAVSTLGNGNTGNIKITATDSVSVDESSFIDSSVFLGEGNGGKIDIETGLLSVTNNSFIAASVIEGEGNGGAIDITTDSLFVRNNSSLLTVTLGKGNAGSLRISATDSVSFESSIASSGVFFGAEGDGGDINITARSLSLSDGSVLSATTAAQGDAGDVQIVATDSISLDQASAATSQVLFGAQGDGGDINITARSLSLSDGSAFSATTAAQGDAGNVMIQIGDSIFLDGARNISIDAQNGIVGGPTGIFSEVFFGSEGNGGDIDIATGSLFVTNGAAISTSTTGQGNAGNIRITAKDTTSFDGTVNISIFVDDQIVNGELSSSLISEVSPEADGNGGDIDITTDSLSVTNGARVSSATDGRGDAGSIFVREADSVVLDNNSLISAQVNQGAVAQQSSNINIQTDKLFLTNNAQVSASISGQGNAGNILVRDADTISVDNSSISTAVNRNGQGQGGDVTLQTDLLTLNNNAQISASTSGEGNTGQVLIQAQERISLTNNSQITSAVEVGGIGNSEQIDLKTPQLSLGNNSQISAATSGRGNAGSIVVQEADSVSLNNSVISTQVNQGAVVQQSSNIDIQTQKLSLTNRSQVTARTSGQGDAGSILIGDAQDISLSNSAISTESNSVGVAGDVTLTTEQLILEDNSQVSAATVSSQGGGINLQNLDTLQVNNSLISASTQTGTAGKLTVNATDSVQLTGEGGLSVEATNGGTAGDLTVTTQELQVNEGAQVTVSSPQGQAGNLTLAADSIVLNQGTIFAETGISSAQGGANISLDELNLLFLENESLISASALDQANGGNVTIDSTFIIALPPTGAEGSDIIANAVQGNGGRVTVTTQGLFDIAFRPQRTPLNDITVSSEFGLDGVFVENRPDIDPNRGLTELENNFVDAERLIDRSCNAGGAALASSFIFTGRGGIPPSPLDVLESDVMVSDWVSLDEDTPTQTSSESVTPNSSQPRQIIEAQGWVRLANGQIILVAESPTVIPQVNWQNTTGCEIP